MSCKCREESIVEIKFAKVKPEAIIPSKRDEDAGFDIMMCFDKNYIELNPHETKIIPTGIASSFPKDYYFQLVERGSTGILGIAQRSGVIDSGFRGEWGVPITNTSNKLLYITKAVNKIMNDEDNILYLDYSQ